MEPEPFKRKCRTREHVIADLSVNHVERFAFRAGFATQKIQSDYGIDLHVWTFSSEGHCESGIIFLQMKATDHMGRLKHKSYFSVSADQRDLEAWLKEPHPVILVLFDAVAERAYWIHVQDYFRSVWADRVASLQSFRTIRIPISNLLTDESMLEIADVKRKMYRKVGV